MTEQEFWLSAAEHCLRGEYRAGSSPSNLGRYALCDFIADREGSSEAKQYLQLFCPEDKDCSLPWWSLWDNKGWEQRATAACFLAAMAAT